jgi:ABC-type siderophore export system fused ATPase/permease subunit
METQKITDEHKKQLDEDITPELYDYFADRHDMDNLTENDYETIIETLGELEAEAERRAEDYRESHEPQRDESRD